jgi:hypothetical protein
MEPAVREMLARAHAAQAALPAPAAAGRVGQRAGR